MATTKVTVTIDTDLIAKVDQLVSKDVFTNRSQTIQKALQENLGSLRRTRLTRECAKLNPREEQAFAEYGMEQELATWPEY